MSSMRNAVQRRNHKERGQLQSRQKLGILEKHKDYALRAKDYNDKKRRLKILRQKAAERNPDEFHFEMMRSRTDAAGRKIADRGNQALSHEAVQLLKTQDAGYLRTMAAKTRKDIQKLEQSVILEKNDDDMMGETTISLPGVERSANKTLFADDEDEQEAAVLERTGSFREDDESEDSDSKAPPKSKFKRQRARQSAWREAKMEALKKREKDLSAAEAALSLERARMSNRVGGVNKNGVKFKVRQRKR